MTPRLKRGRYSKDTVNKEEISEDYCFICKDGGLLLVCEFKNCIKAYHPQCVGKDATFLESRARWICNWHSCFICSRSSKVHCFGCTNAVCKRCIKSALFVHVRGNKGFCNNCLKLALLVEENRDIDSDGGKVDFKDRDTYEFLFKEYWEIIREKEGLTLDDVQTADILLKKGDNYRNSSDSDQDFDADMDLNLEIGTDPLIRGLKEPKKYSRKVKSKKREFIGWGSRSLIEFLSSIGKDTSKPFSQYEVHDIIKLYVHENKLFDPEKKKKVVCDARLFSVFGRKKVNRNKIYDLLESHFAENQEDSEEDELSDENEDGTAKSCKRQRTGSSAKKYEKENVQKTPRSCYASVTAKNIKLVYLRRSLVQDFLKNPETFDEKVIGSFVRIKSDPNDYFQRNAYQLVQVTGTKKVSGTGNINEEVTVQVSNMNKGIHIYMLSDDDFREEEIEDLHQRVKDGLLEKLTIVDLEQKAKSLHEILTKHWIEREIVRLQHLIDRANEKGWRRELGEYLERRQLLKTPSEKLRLLQEVPEVIPEETEPEIPSQDLYEDEKPQKDDSPKSTTPRGSTLDDLLANGTSSNSKVGGTHAAAPLDLPGTGDTIHVNCTSEVMPSLFAGDGKGDAVGGRLAEKVSKGTGDAISVNDASEVMANLFTVDGKRDPVDGKVADKLLEGMGVRFNVNSASDLMANLAGGGGNEDSDAVEEKAADKEVEGTGGASLLTSDQNGSEHRDSKQSPGADENEGDQASVKKRVYGIPVVDIDDDDDDIGPESFVWHYLDPHGNPHGPFPLFKLKEWNDEEYFAPDFKVWKTGQTQEEAILLKDALCQLYPEMLEKK